ncbi:MAG: phosphoadenylyl-sulfate reductase [Caldilineaceae bacterium]
MSASLTQAVSLRAEGARSAATPASASSAGFLDWTRVVFARLSNRFDAAATTDLLRWSIQTFGTGLSIGTSFGASGLVLMDLALQIQPDVDIFYVDTGYFFPETLQLITQLERRYQRTFRRVTTQLSIGEQEKRYGPALYQNDPDLCCHLRKVSPMKQALTDSTAWVSALRHDQASTRQAVPMVQWNERYNIVKIAPLIHWAETDIWQYIHEHELPYNELHDRNYPSIGCWPCTHAVQPGDDLRAGRWRGSNKVECGLHWELVTR